MIIDSHCHLDYEPMYSSLDDVISRADKSQIKYILTISVKDNKYKNILEILKKYPKVYGTYGIHPHEAKNHKEIKKNIILEKISYSKKIIGIGETGLDFFHNHSDEKDQIRLFEEHIMASIESNLPLIVHSRNAEEKTFEILSTYSKDKELKILMHCFTGSKKFAKKLLDINAYFSASGIVTFKKTNDLRETFKFLPLDRLLIETDAPYLSPEPLRGKVNEPCNIVHTLKYLSKIKNLDINKTESFTSNNFLKLFNIKENI